MLNFLSSHNTDSRGTENLIPRTYAMVNATVKLALTHSPGLYVALVPSVDLLCIILTRTVSSLRRYLFSNDINTVGIF